MTVVTIHASTMSVDDDVELSSALADVDSVASIGLSGDMKVDRCVTDGEVVEMKVTNPGRQRWTKPKDVVGGVGLQSGEHADQVYDRGG